MSLKWPLTFRFSNQSPSPPYVHKSHAFHPFDHPNNTTLYLVGSSIHEVPHRAIFSSLPPPPHPRPKYLPQHINHENCLLVFFPYCKKLSFTGILNKGKNYIVSVKYLKFNFCFVKYNSNAHWQSYQMVKKTCFYETQRFITTYTKAPQTVPARTRLVLRFTNNESPIQPRT